MITWCLHWPRPWGVRETDLQPWQNSWVLYINDGKRIPTYRFTKVEFAKDTPYETIVDRPTPTPVQVMLPEIAQILKETLGKVVSEGTARRLSNSFQQGDGSPFVIGGKTGTGDNRILTLNLLRT